MSSLTMDAQMATLLSKFITKNINKNIETNHCDQRKQEKPRQIWEMTKSKLQAIFTSPEVEPKINSKKVK